MRGDLESADPRRITCRVDNGSQATSRAAGTWADEHWIWRMRPEPGHTGAALRTRRGSFCQGRSNRGLRWKNVGLRYLEREPRGRIFSTTKTPP